MQFDQWLQEMDRIGVLMGMVGDKPFSACGDGCWRLSYDDGMTPAQAIAEDLSNA